MTDEKKPQNEEQAKSSSKPHRPLRVVTSPVKVPLKGTGDRYQIPESLGGLVDDLRQKFSEAILEHGEYRGELTVIVDRERLIEICEYLRDDPRWAFDFCGDVTAVDYLLQPVEPRFENVVHLYSIAKRHRLRVKCPIDESDMKCPSLTKVWSGANYYERETYDMYGVLYDGHPDLTRILLADDWEGFPLRKDFPLGGVKSFYYKHDTEPRAGEPEDLVPRIREQLTDV